MPDAISASRIDDGPTSGTTRMPAACAAATSAAPGSATPGQPASDSRPDVVRRSRSGASSAARWPARRRGAAARGCRASAIGCGGSSDLRNARAGFGVSTTQCASAARDVDRARGQHVGRRRRRRAGWERGRACRACGRRAQAVGDAASEHVDAFVAQQPRQRDQRQADQRGRIVAFDALEQRDAERFRLDGAGAVVRLLAVEVGVDLGVGAASRNVLATSTSAVRQRPLAASTSATPVWNDDRAAGQRAQLRDGARRGCRACRSAWPAQSATWSEPITSASG